MDDVLQGVYEYLFTSKELLERGDLSDMETEVLSGKIKHFSELLGVE